MKKIQNQFGSPAEAIVYPLLLVLLMWVFYWAEFATGSNMVRLGVRPQHWSTWSGVIFMPLLHAPSDIGHIINNSIPITILFGALVYYYREIAFKVLAISWVVTGTSILLFARDYGAFHIGMSGVIYALFGFLFISGFIRNFRPLQAVSLFVLFVYGSMIWGIFPLKASVSWEGHFSGLAIGILLAIVYRKRGPIGPKYQYEIEKDLGIEPPDLEGVWREQQEQIRLYQEQMRLQQEEIARQREEGALIVYHIIPKATDSSAKKHPDGNATK